MAENTINVLIGAKWTGGTAVKQAGADLRSLGNNAALSSVELAAIQARSRLLGSKLSELGTAVAQGNKTVAEANVEYEKYRQSFVNLREPVQQATFQFDKFVATTFKVAAVLSLVALGARQFGKAVAEGAEVDLVIRRFDRLAESIGTTGEALQRDLSPATRRLLSDVEQMATATDFLALGLVRTHDQAVRLANVAAQLGFNMNHLVLTMTNLTVLRFDQLGVRVDGFREKVEQLEDAGLDATAAFREAFIQQAEEQLQIVGSRAEYAAGRIDILTASWENYVNSVKLGLAEGAIPIVNFFIRGVLAATEAEAAANRYADSIGNIGAQRLAIEDLRAALSDTGEAVESATALFPEQTAEASKRALEEVLLATIKSTDSYEELQSALEDLGFTFTESEISLEGWLISFDELNRLIEKADLSEITEQFEEVDQKLGNFIDRSAEVNKSVEQLAAGRFGLDISFEEFEQLADDLDVPIEKARELAIQIGGIEEAARLLGMIEDPADFFRDIEDIREELRLDALLKDAELTNDQFARLAITLGGIQEAIEFLQRAGREGVFQRQERPALQARFEPIPEELQELGDLFEDFQSDLSDIVDREAEQREQIEEQTEKRRNDIIRDYGARRARDERNFNRRLEREDRQLNRDIEKERERSADRQADLREDANQKLADLERDHLDRIADIIDSADLQIEEAASRLDAQAIASIERQREKSLRDEEKNYKKQREEIGRELQKRLEEEREAAEERIEELKEFHDQRQKEEKEDFDFRQKELEFEHEERLRLLEDQKNDRLREISDQARDEAQAREQDYIDQRRKLTDHWVLRSNLEDTYRSALLTAEANFWQARINMVPSDGGGGTGGDGGGGGTMINPPGGGGDGQRPSRHWLEQMVLNIANPTTTEAALGWYRWMRDRSDAELAAWIERHSDVDVPGYARGTLSAPGGLAIVGEEGPELMDLPGGTRIFDAGTTQRMMGGVSVDTIQISVWEARDARATALEVRREMTRIFEELS